MTITSTANAIRKDTDQPLEGAVGGAAGAGGVLAPSEDELVAAVGGVATAGGVPAVSEDVLAVTSGAVVTAGIVSDRLRGRKAGVRADSDGVLTVAAGWTTPSAVGAAVAAGETTISAAGAAVAVGVTTVSAVGVAAGAGEMEFSATVLVVATTGAVADAGGVLTVSDGVLAAAMGAAAATVQCSEIMFSSVTAKLLSTAAGLAPVALCPMRVTSWSKCCLKSTLLVVILKMCPVLSPRTV